MNSFLASSADAIRTDEPVGVDPGPADHPRPAARVQLIDGFGCAWHGQRLSLPHSTQRLVALLALAGGPMARHQLGSTLWPDVGIDHALGALRTTVWRLNRLCPNILVNDGDGLHLTAEVDLQIVLAQADRLLRGVPISSRDLLAGDLVRVFRSCADLLPGWYDDWVLFHRERLLAIRVEVLGTAAARLRTDGCLPDALDLALAALSAEPLDERLHMLVASIHLAQGNASEALRQYRLCTDLFAAELGVSPSDQFRSMLPIVIGPPAAPTAEPGRRSTTRPQQAGRSTARRSGPRRSGRTADSWAVASSGPAFAPVRG